MTMDRDHSLDALMALDGVSFFVDAARLYQARFVVKLVGPDEARPNGLAYSLTLHDSSGARLVGFDNAHPVRRRRGPGGANAAFDHRHLLDVVRPYVYRDAATLLEDFWRCVSGSC